MTRTRLFASLTALVFLVNLARVVYAPLVEPLQDAFGVGPGTIGIVVTLVWVGSALPRIPTGYLLTLVPRHYVVMAAGAVLTAAGAFAATADSVTTLAIGAVLMGLASGVYFVSANPLVSELYPERVGRALGIHGMASQVAAVAAAPLVGLVLWLESWRLVFAGISVGAFVVTVVLVVVALRTEMPAASGVDRNLLGAIRAQWRLVVAGIFLIGAASFVWQGVFNFYVSYLLTKGLSESLARDLLTVAFLTGVPAFLVSGRHVDRFPAVPYILVIIAGFVVSLFALTYVQGLLALIVVSAVLGYVVHSLFPAIDAYLLGTLPDEHRGGAYALFSGVMMLTQSVGSSFVGAFVDIGFSYDLVFQALAAVLAVNLIILVAVWATGRFPGSPGLEAVKATG